MVPGAAGERAPLLARGAGPRLTSQRPWFGVRGDAPADYVISLFEPAADGRSAYAATGGADDAPFYRLADEIRASIDAGVQPQRIALGSSGSYFVRVRRGDALCTVGVFKPLDEEPYGNLK